MGRRAAVDAVDSPNYRPRWRGMHLAIFVPRALASGTTRREMEDSMDYEHGPVIDSLRQRLLQRRQAIVGRVARTDGFLGELDESSPAEVEEEAQELNQARIVAELGQRGRAELDAIDVAIELMERGDYGFCEECEEPIDVARLEVSPTARRCTTCAEASERRARQMARVTRDETDDEEL